MCKANDGVLEDLLYSCHYLQKLSLAGLTLNSEMIKHLSLQNGHTLEVLDLQCSKGWNLTSIQHIIKNCQQLREINFCNTSLSSQSIEFLVNNLTPRIEKLNLDFMTYFSDEHLNTLVTRARNIKALSLRGTPITDDSLISITNQLNTTDLEELDVRDTHVDLNKLIELRSMTKLRLLNCWHLNNNEIKKVKKELPHLSINGENLKIASPYHTFKSTNGLWEIEALPCKL